jgi:hypothetical protein
MVGLGNVDNTSDVNKPVSTAQAALIGTKANSTTPTISGTLTADAITTNKLIYSGGTLTAASNFAVYGTSLMQGNLTMQSPATIVGISGLTVGLGNANQYIRC